MAAVFKGAVRGIAIFLCIEFILILACLTILGAYSEPLEFIVDICNSIETTPVALAVFVFVCGTIANLILMAVIAVTTAR